jgi:hypothetical protein
LQAGKPSPEVPPEDCLPATIMLDPLYDEDLFTATASQNPMPSPAPDPTGTNDITITNDCHTPHPFYQHLLQWSTDHLSPYTFCIASPLTGGVLHICADGAYIKEFQQGSHSWILSDSNQNILWKGVGPSTGHSAVMTSYRAELCGITSALFMLLWICNQEDVEYGSVTLYCDNEGALNQVFNKSRPFKNPYDFLSADIDLITCARDLLLQLPIEVHVKHEWVKGHYTGKKRQLKHELNHLADTTAREYNSSRRPPSSTPPVPCPTSEVELIHNNSIITSRLLQLVKSAIHDAPLRTHITSHAGWDDTTFDRVDWTSHEKAFNSHSRLHQISLTKLSNSLYHTNYQDNKCYQTSVLCPCCNQQVETLSHVFTCQSTTTTAHRTIAQTTLTKALETLQTPKKIIDTFLHGLSHWEQQQIDPDHTCILPFTGSVIPSDCHIVQAYQEQTKIGWEHFLRGRISLKWSSAYRASKGSYKQRQIDALPWAKGTILALWDYSTSPWKFRNGVVHGTSKEERAEKELISLQSQVEQQYRLYGTDKFLISPQFTSLFTKKTLQERLQMGRDSLSSWLRTVEEAKRHQQNFRKSLTKLPSRWFSSKVSHNASQGSTTDPTVNPRPCSQSTSLTLTDGNSAVSPMAAPAPLHVNNEYPIDFDPG